jgi:GDPmannose 4,6-dehydratase
MRALITGIAGQDGSYLAELLVQGGHEVHGFSRRGSGAHLATVADAVRIHTAPLFDLPSLSSLLRELAPDRVFHFAAHSFAGDAPAEGIAGDVAATLVLLEAVARVAPHARFLFAGSAAVFAGAATSPQDEGATPAPTTPYALGKHLGAEAVRFFRSRGLFACTAILFSHESPRRPPHFVSKKLAAAAARAARGETRPEPVGDLDAVRDWGYAPEYVAGMARMLELAQPEDLVLATGVSHTVREMADAAFAVVGKRAADYLVVDPALVRPRENTPLVGNPARARHVLGWRPQTNLASLMRIMVEAELNA